MIIETAIVSFWGSKFFDELIDLKILDLWRVVLQPEMEGQPLNSLVKNNQAS